MPPKQRKGAGKGKKGQQPLPPPQQQPLVHPAEVVHPDTLSQDGGDPETLPGAAAKQVVSEQLANGFTPDYLFELFLLVFLIGNMLIQNFNVHMLNLDGYNTSYIAFTAILFTKRVAWKFVYSAWISSNTISVGLVFRIAISMIPTLYLVKSSIKLVAHHDVQTLLFLVYPYCLFFSLFGNSTAESLRRYNASRTANTQFEPAGISLNFRQHLKHILYASLEAGYYATILPVRFLGDRNAVYDQRCGTLICIYGVLNTAVLLMTNLVSSGWHDFYLQARSIGCWAEVKRSSGAQAWHQQEWPQGAQVKYNKKVYVAHGQINTAEPDDWVAWLFYRAFRNPRQVATNIVLFEVGIVSSQIAFLLIVRKWQAVAGWAALIGLSYIVLIYTLVVRHKVINQAPS